MRMYLSPFGINRRSCGLPALLAVLVVVGLANAVARANPPAGEAVAGKHYTRETVFRLPIKIEEKSRGNIKEVHLYVKSPTSNWQRVDQASPAQSEFKFKAPQDGEYWFTLVTVDMKGTPSPSPSDLSRLPADEIVMVVVDTQPPAFDLQPVKVASGDLLLRCVVSDANPDYKALKITYRGSDQAVRVLEPLPGQPGVFRVPGPEVFLNPVHVTVTDLAGNTTSREVTLNDGVAKAPTPPSTPTPAGNPPAQPGSGLVQTGGMVPQAGSGVVQAGGPSPASPPGVVEPRSVPQPPPSPAQQPANGVPRQVINTTRASLDYRIDQVGPSGVGKVEVWLTSDNGNSWQMRCEDMDRRSPAEFDLPANDGVYGVRVVITNGNGFGGHAPVAGDQPHCWIEVDTTPPVVQLREIEPVTTGGTIDIRWTASDKNLGNEPVALYYATRKEGPWVPMARNLKNDGLYHWAFPRDVGSQFFVRIEVSDAVGNVTRVESPNAVILDLTEPKASVVGVSGIHNGQK
jgi:hypothetical protein